MGLFDRFRRKKPKTEEKSWTLAGYPLPVTGGWLPSDSEWNFWQRGKDPLQVGPNSTVHACVDAYAQTIAALKMHHVRVTDEEGTVPIKTSALSRIARRPNGYQTRSDFVLNLVKSLMLRGNCYAYAIRNDRNEITELHLTPPNTTVPYIDNETQSIFYGLGQNPMLSPETLRAMIPARDMLHIRLYTPEHPLVGISPIANLASSIAANNAITNHQATFFTNMRRPSGVLSTGETLTRDQMKQLRDAWDQQSQSLNSGGVPILSAGLKWEAMSITSQDAQTIEASRMSVEEIARAFRVPLPLIGDTRNSNYSNVEQLVSAWLAMGLGFVLEHIERSFDMFFDVAQDTSCQFDADTLLRTDFQGRLQALSSAVSHGIYSPNEARKKEGLEETCISARSLAFRRKTCRCRLPDGYRSPRRATPCRHLPRRLMKVRLLRTKNGQYLPEQS